MSGPSSYLRLVCAQARSVPTVKSITTVRGIGWSVGFVEFYDVAQAKLAKEELGQHEVDYGVRLTITYARKQKPPAALAGQYGNDHGGEEFGFGMKAPAEDKRVEGRERFSFRKADWQNRISRDDIPRY